MLHGLLTKVLSATSTLMSTGSKHRFLPFISGMLERHAEDTDGEFITSTCASTPTITQLRMHLRDCAPNHTGQANYSRCSMVFHDVQICPRGKGTLKLPRMLLVMGPAGHNLCVAITEPFGQFINQLQQRGQRHQTTGHKASVQCFIHKTQ